MVLRSSLSPTKFYIFASLKGMFESEICRRNKSINFFLKVKRLDPCLKLKVLLILSPAVEHLLDSSSEAIGVASSQNVECSTSYIRNLSSFYGQRSRMPQGCSCAFLEKLKLELG